MIYDMIHLTAIGLTPGGSSTVNICTQTIHRTTQSTQTIHRTTQSTQTTHRTTQSTQTKHRKTQSTQKYIEQYNSLIRKSADRSPPLQGITWHLPYN
jgi:gamma-glutamyltranspeptidase